MKGVDLMTNAVIYARYSSDRQNEMSIEGQIEECRKYAEANDIFVLQEYVDRALTATSDKRPNFLRMIDDSRDGNFELILVYQFDRFSRNKNDSGYYKKILADNGVKVVSAKEQIANDSSGVITEGLLEVFADYFSKQLSEKVHRGMYQRAEQCKFNGGTMTFGYAVDKDGYYVVDEKTGPIVREIFERIANGETARAIGDNLNERGIKTVRGNNFTKNSLQNILRNEKYRGVYTFGEVRIEGGVPRIVSDELFEEVQQAIRRNNHRNRPAKEDYLLTGKLYCGHCGRIMMGTSGTSHTGAIYRYYICKDPEKICDKKNVPKDFIEKEILRICRKSLSKEIVEAVVSAVAEYNKRDQESPEIIRLKSEIKEMEKKIDKLITEIEDGLSSKRVADRLSQREFELEVLNKSLKKEETKQRIIQPHVVRTFMYKLARGTTDTLEYQKMLINVFVDKIYLYDDHFTIFFNNSKKGANTSKKEVETIEKYFFEPSSESTSCCVPNKVDRLMPVCFVFCNLLGVRTLYLLSPSRNSPIIVAECWHRE